MRRRDILLGSLGAATAGAAHGAVKSDPSLYADARAFIQEQLQKPGAPSLSVAVFREGRVDWEEAFGWADREGSIRATPDTPYSLASISKSFTGTTLAVLAERKALDLDRPVNGYLGAGKLRSTAWPGDSMTVRQVANHTSGLPFHVQFFYADRPYQRPPMDVTIETFGFPATEPGTAYFYSNLGYGILGEMAGRVAGVPFADLLRREVCLPLGLTHTGLGPATGSV